MKVGRIEQLTGPAPYPESAMTGSLSFAVAVAKAEAYDRLCAEIDRLQQGIKAALAMSPACTIDYNVRIRLERLLRPADQE